MRRLLASLLLGLAALPALALPYSGIHFFGDSLSDVGNVSAVYALVPHPPGAPAAIPGPPYDPAGRLSNGPIYADALAAGLGLAATPSVLGGNDYAFGGARTRYHVLGAPFPGILDQVTAFRALPGAADPGALYVVWGGSNNLQDILLGVTTDVSGNPIPDVAGTIGDIAAAVLGLYAEGARRVLVPNVVDLSLVPRVRELGAAAQAVAQGLAFAYDSGLAAALAALEASSPGLDIIAFDTRSALYDVIGNAGDYGFTNLTDRCYTGDDINFAGGGSICADPDSFLFWDGIHPTSALHALLGARMLAAVIPEPGSGALVVLGLLAAMAAGRRRMAVSGS